MSQSHPYRTHTCGQLRKQDVGKTVKISGWVHRKRDHGGVLFIDVRDHYGLTQIVLHEGNKFLAQAESLRLESVITVDGDVVARSDETTNKDLPTGDVEVSVTNLVTQTSAQTPLPIQVNSDDEVGDDIRLRYRYLDLRRERMQRQMKLRIDVMDTIRSEMKAREFNEFQTPILTTSSPEGARDFIVPSRQHPGKFYALPQAPQQFKQLLMISGFDKYFQIAPCFRDEDARADRCAGEFYQLDFEMSFVTQDDVFAAIEPVAFTLFDKFSDFTGRKIETASAPFRRIPYDESMLRYGTDKPDLRNPLLIDDVTDVFARDDVSFKAFRGVIDKGGVVRAIRVPNVADKPRSFFDKLNDWARGEGALGLGYIAYQDGEGKGPIAKFLETGAHDALRDATGATDGDAVFFACDMKNDAAKLAGKARTCIADELDLIDKSRFELCWIIDFPMYEWDETNKKINFSHNPFSMPQGGMDALKNQDPLEVKANLYDLVCNGYELASGAIRNHNPELMVEAFKIAGYDAEAVKKEFGGMYTAFQYGPPPHGGAALGIERIIMLLAGQNFVREVVPFPLNQQAEDLMMNGPSVLAPEQLRDVHIRVDIPKHKVGKNAA